MTDAIVRQSHRPPMKCSHSSGRGVRGIEHRGAADRGRDRRVETNHFSLWHDKAGNAVAQPLAGVTDPETGLHFPDLNASGGEET